MSKKKKLVMSAFIGIIIIFLILGGIYLYKKKETPVSYASDMIVYEVGTEESKEEQYVSETTINVDIAVRERWMTDTFCTGKIELPFLAEVGLEWEKPTVRKPNGSVFWRSTEEDYYLFYQETEEEIILSGYLMREEDRPWQGDGKKVTEKAGHCYLHFSKDFSTLTVKVSVDEYTKKKEYLLVAKNPVKTD